jgi:hypothetical protein
MKEQVPAFRMIYNMCILSDLAIFMIREKSEGDAAAACSLSEPHWIYVKTVA